MNENGFTLIELLLVFTVFLIISSSSLILLKPYNSSLEREEFFSQFKSDIFYAQQYAICHQREVTINIIPEKRFYYIRDRLMGVNIIERTYSEGINVREGSLPLYIQFTQEGNIVRFGTIFVNIGEDPYRITFLIGKGRFYVTRE